MSNNEARNVRRYIDALSKDLELMKTPAEVRAVKEAIRTEEFKLTEG